MSRKPTKGKGHAPPGDFIALGSKVRGAEADPKLLPPKKIGLPSVGGKRDGQTAIPGSSLVAKKQKVVGQPFALGRAGEGEGRSSPTVQPEQYDEIAKEVEPHNLLNAILDAGEDESKIEELLCGAVRYLKMNRAKPDSSMFLTLMFLAKSRPTIFLDEVVMKAFCSLLKRDVSMNFKSKGNPLVSVLACNVLMAAFAEELHWPDDFVMVYLEDALGERVWVDRPDCKVFVDNILTGFGTRLPKSTVLGMDPTKPEPASAGASPNPSNYGEDEERSLESTESGERPSSSLSEDSDTYAVIKRYTYQQVSIEMEVVEVMREQLAKRQVMDSGSRNVVRVMTATCAYNEIRMVAAGRLEMWLQNPKLTRPAQDLLMALCMNCDQHSPADVEVMSQLAKIRLKTKPLVNHYILGIRELLSHHPDNIGTLMTHTVYNELSTSRNPNNMALITVMFQHSSERAAKLLAEIFQELLTNRDDYLRALRTLLREIMRAVRHDMNFPAFALGLMEERNGAKFRNMEPQHKDRLLLSLTDLIAQTALLSVTPSVREAASAHSRADHKDLELLYTFQQQVAVIQRDATWWLHTVVPKMFEVKPLDFMHCLRKLLFVEKADQYCKLDNWPSESDRSMLLRLVSEVPVLEDTLMRVLIIGLTRELQLSAGDILDLSDTLIRRAAVLQGDGFEVLAVERLKLFDAIFNLCAYRHPENIVLPKGYTPPTLAIANLYWKAWVMLLMLAAFNPATIGLSAWENYPTLKCLMEMVMTNNFRFPPPTMAVDEAAIEEIRSRDKQITELEKQDILEFEGHLAAASSKVAITEANSLLLAQLTTMDPRGLARKPPDPVLEQLRGLNASLQLGAMLCRSRSPDFLLDIIHRQGASQSMPWLADLVESSEGSLDVLPVQCLCEFLLHDVPPEGFVYDDDDDKGEQQKKKQKLRKQEQLLARLQSLLYTDSSEQHAVSEVLGYFLKRLTSQQTASRLLAVKGLSMVLSKSHIQPSEEGEEMEEETAAVRIIPTHRWLVEQLPSIPHFELIKPETCTTLRQACQVETDAASVSAYIVFLSRYTVDLQLQALDDLLLDLATLIVERPTLINHLLPTEGASSDRCELVLTAMIELFYAYLCKAQQPKEEYLWSNTQDQILLQWESGKSATMNVLVVHAMIILLTYGQPKGKSHYEELIVSWFPPGGASPTAYLVDTSEEALLLPDWLKLRMIRSSSERLVDAALLDLEPAQLVLFVQSFGLPVRSMSKLLTCLDKAVSIDRVSMEAAVVDKMYMAQLVDVQNMRGAEGGEKFRILLRGETPLQPVLDVPMPLVKRRTRTMSSVCRAPNLVPAQKDISQLAALLRTMFGDDINIVQRQQAYRTIMKSVTKESSMAEKMVTVLHKVLCGGDGVQVFTAMQEFHTMSSPLLRTLAAKQDRNSGLKFPAKLLTPPDVSAVTAYYDQQVELLGRLFTKPPERPTHGARGGRRRSGQDTTGFHADMVLRQALEEPGARSEGEVMTVLKESLRMRDSNERVATMCHLLTPSAVQPDAPVALGAGLLVDWLELLDPEVVGAVPDLQRRMLFAHTHHKGASGDMPGRRSNQPYLLALLTHQSSWASLHSCIQLLLGPGAIHKSYNATAVLDFLWACLHIPKIWQGRDKKVPKNYEPEDVLELTGQEIQSVVNYILQESLTKDSETQGQSSTSSSHTVSIESAAGLNRRLPLLLLCCCDQKHLVRAAFDHLYSHLRNNSPESGVSQHLLVQLYLAVPQVLRATERKEGGLAGGADGTITGTSQLDALCHRLLSALGRATPGKASENRMDDANITCRKVATEHPLLMLRQLPMLAALLQGRSQFSFGEMRHRNHNLLYTHTLGVLELLQPYLFNPQYTEAWEAIVESYCELIRNHGLEKRYLASLISKFIHILHNFFTQDAVRAHAMLHKYTHLLSMLSSQDPDFATLKSLLAGLALPRGENSESSLSSESSASDPTSGTLTHRPSSPWPVSQLLPFKQKISKEAPMEDVLEVLRDLDETSKRKVDLLHHFKSDLSRLMTERNEVIRNITHNLIMRYLRHNPGSASEFVPTFARCLDSSNQDVVQTALKNLAEFTLLAQEHGTALLKKAFTVGVTMKVETGSFISDAIQLLSLETLN